jgi:alkanesulfonate monooxygenase SsuD/methylene tetrahydromethanopterin reductase-like flavin-dependent oxidoreductase (luciferase family)
MEFPFSGVPAYWRWVDLCEAGGVDSLWQTDRLLSREPMLECMSAMAALAGRTRRLKFGMNVVSLALRDPVLLARQCATIDVLSEGRLLPAFGIGSPRGPEWAAYEDAREEDRRGARGHRAAVAAGERRLRRRAFPPDRGLDLAPARAG